jgi:UDP-N-acetylglucosamine acyltransferase
MCERDVPPFVIVQGDRARVRALNVVGLERRGVPAASIAALRRAFARLWGSRTESFAAVLGDLDRSDPSVAALAAWLLDPARSIRRRSALARDAVRTAR